MELTDAALREVKRLRPKAGEVLAVSVDTGDASSEELAGLAASLQQIADRTRATVLILTPGTTLDVIDEREMLARGWMRVGPLAHTTDQLSQSTSAEPDGSTLPTRR